MQTQNPLLSDCPLDVAGAFFLLYEQTVDTGAEQVGHSEATLSSSLEGKVHAEWRVLQKHDPSKTKKKTAVTLSDIYTTIFLFCLTGLRFCTTFSGNFRVPQITLQWPFHSPGCAHIPVGGTGMSLTPLNTVVWSEPPLACRRQSRRTFRRSHTHPTSSPSDRKLEKVHPLWCHKGWHYGW